MLHCKYCPPLVQTEPDGIAKRWAEQDDEPRTLSERWGLHDDSGRSDDNDSRWCRQQGKFRRESHIWHQNSVKHEPVERFKEQNNERDDSETDCKVSTCVVAAGCHY